MAIQFVISFLLKMCGRTDCYSKIIRNFATRMRLHTLQVPHRHWNKRTFPMKQILIFLFLLMTCHVASAQQNNTPDSLAIQHPEYLPKLTIGTMAPELCAKDTTGNTVSLADYRGKYVIVDFWASWCGDCRRELPLLKSLHKDTENMLIGGATVEWIGYSFDQNMEQWRNYLRNEAMPWKQVSNLRRTKDDTTYGTWGLHWIPAFFIIDPDGRIVATAITAQGLRTALTEVAERKPTLYAFGDSYVANHVRPAN